MKKTTTLLITTSALLIGSSNAAMTWTAGAGNFGDEANWEAHGGGAPSPGSITKNSNISTTETGGEIIIGNGSAVTLDLAHLHLGDNTLSVSGSSSLVSAWSSFPEGIRSNSKTASITGASSVYIQFSDTVNWDVSGGSTLQFRGGGTPYNGSTVNLADTASILIFDNETYTAFDTEHASNTTAFGNALIFGADPFAYEPGDNAIATAIGTSGVSIQAVPEPSSTALLGLGGLALILRRRK